MFINLKNFFEPAAISPLIVPMSSAKNSYRSASTSLPPLLKKSASSLAKGWDLSVLNNISPCLLSDGTCSNILCACVFSSASVKIPAAPVPGTNIKSPSGYAF